jgi:hypothetical protein
MSVELVINDDFIELTEDDLDMIVTHLSTWAINGDRRKRWLLQLFVSARVAARG